MKFTLLSIQLVTFLLFPTLSIAQNYLTTSLDSILKPDLVIMGSEINKGISVSPLELMKGKVPGLNIISDGGSLQRDYILDIKGNRILNNFPTTIILDGNQFYGDLSLIHPSDIESIEIVTDPFLLGIISNRKNNALVIKTKKGKEGIHISFTSKLGISSIQNKYDLLNADEFRNAAHDKAIELDKIINSKYLGNYNTDWQDHIYRNAISNDQYLNLSGTIQKYIPFSASLSKSLHNGILKNNSLNKTNAGINISPTIIDKHLKLNFSFRYLNYENSNPDYSIFETVSWLNPTFPTQITEDSPEYQKKYFAYRDNSLQDLSNGLYHHLNTSTLSTVNLDYKGILIKGLHMNLTASHFKDTLRNNQDLYFPYDQNELVSPIENSTINEGNEYTILKAQIDYNIEISNFLDISIFNGAILRNSTHSIQDYRENYTLTETGTKSSISRSYRSFERRKQQYFFSGINISLHDRYLLGTQLSAIKSASIFTDYKEYTYPYFFFKWNISKEKFFTPNQTISNLSLKLSYVSQPKQAINWEENYDGFIIMFPRVLMTEMNSQIHATMLNNQLDVFANFYIRKEAQITFSNVNISGSSIYSVRNKGVDLIIKYNLIHHNDLQWTILSSLSFLSPKVAEIPEHRIYYESDIGVLVPGHSPGAFIKKEQAYNDEGKPIEGSYISNNIIGDGPESYFESVYPNFYANISNTLKYKNWIFNASARIILGNIIDDTSIQRPSKFVIYGDNTFRQSLQTNFNSYDRNSSHFINKGSFFRLDNLSITYQYKTKRDQATIDFSAICQNALLLTKYNGPDPEITSGIGSFIYPYARTFTFQVDFNF